MNTASSKIAPFAAKLPVGSKVTGIEAFFAAVKGELTGTILSYSLDKWGDVQAEVRVDGVADRDVLTSASKLCRAY